MDKCFRATRPFLFLNQFFLIYDLEQTYNRNAQLSFIFVYTNSMPINRLKNMQATQCNVDKIMVLNTQYIN
jgi:hypothetical protein